MENENSKEMLLMNNRSKVTIRGWGGFYEEALEEVAQGMIEFLFKGIADFGDQEKIITVESFTLNSLTFVLLDEIIYFCKSEFFLPKEIAIVQFDLQTMTVHAKLIGKETSEENFPWDEKIKAVNYLGLNITELEDKRFDISVQLDVDN